MSLNKLTQRLRAHDWMAALIELIIVIAGILIALQVSNWNQDRSDRARADNYYRRIHANLETDIKRLATVRAFYKGVSEYGRAALVNGEEGELLDGSAWKTVLAWYQAGQIFPFEMEDTSFTELRDAGQTGLIVDEALRGRLAAYYRLGGTGITGAILRHDPAYRVQIRGITPTKVQEYIWANCFRQLEGVNQMLVDCPAPISEHEANVILASYHAADGLLPNLRYWQTWLGVSEKVFVVTDNEAKALLETIEKVQGH